MDRQFDEGRVRVGTRGYVRYMTGKPIAVEVVEIRVSAEDGKLYARCDDGTGGCRIFRLDEVITSTEEEANS